MSSAGVGSDGRFRCILKHRGTAALVTWWGFNRDNAAALGVYYNQNTSLRYTHMLETPHRCIDAERVFATGEVSVRFCRCMPTWPWSVPPHVYITAGLDLENTDRRTPRFALLLHASFPDIPRIVK